MYTISHLHFMEILGYFYNMFIEVIFGNMASEKAR